MINPQTLYGRVASVNWRQLGSSLAVAAITTDTSLVLDDVVEFHEDGGTGIIDGTTFTWTAVDDDTNTLTLSGALGANVSAGEYAQITHAGAADILDVRAMVMLNDDGDETLNARVPHRLIDVMPEGIRDDGEGEAVILINDGVDWWVQDIVAKMPSATGEFIDPATFTGPTSDGSPPGSSPTPVVESAINALAVTWDGVVNNDPVTYEVHVSETTGFTPDGTTLYAEINGTAVFIHNLPDQSPLSSATTYYVKLIAKDVDGSAAASAQDSANPTAVSVTTDGNPPADSPVPVVQPGTTFFVAKWDEEVNADPVTYEVHVSATTGFTPGAGTLYTETPALSAIIKKLPNGDPFEYETDYFFKIIAKDADGAAAASAQDDAQMTQIVAADITAGTITANEIAALTITAAQIAADTITGAKIAAGTITGDNIDAATITGDNIAAETITTGHMIAGSITAELLAAVLTISSTIQTATSGQRVVIDAAGIRLIDSGENTVVNLPTASGESATFSGNISTAGISISNNLLLAGSSNSIDQSAVLTLLEGQANPAIAPVVNFEYESLVTFATMSTNTRGIEYSATGGAGGATPVYYSGYSSGAGSVYLYEFLASTGALNRSVFITMDSDEAIGGVARIGGHIYFLTYNGAHGWRVYKVDALTFAHESTTSISTGLGYAANGIGLGTDGTNLLLVSWVSNTNGALKQITRYSLDGSDNPVYLDTNTFTGGITRDTSKYQGFTGIAFDGTDYYISMRNNTSSSAFLFVDSVVEVYVQATLTLSVANGSTIKSILHPYYLLKGVAYNGSDIIWAAGSAGSVTMYKYTDWVWSGSNIWWFAHTWKNGGSETLVSPLATKTLQDGAGNAQYRGRVQITIPSFPSGITNARTYAVNNATTPATSALKLEAAATYVTSDSATAYYMIAHNTGGAAPPVSNNFAGQPAELTAVGSTYSAPWSLFGDGTQVLPLDGDEPASPVAAQVYVQGRRMRMYDGSRWRDYVDLDELEYLLSHLSEVGHNHDSRYNVHYSAKITLDNSGAPTHTASGSYQNMGGGGGTDAWTAPWDVRPSGVSAQASTASGSPSLTVKKTGRYLISASARFSSIAAAQVWAVAIWKNGAELVTGGQTNGSTGASGIAAKCSDQVLLQAGDVLEPYAFQNDTASETYLVANPENNYLAMTWLGDA